MLHEALCDDRSQKSAELATILVLEGQHTAPPRGRPRITRRRYKMLTPTEERDLIAAYQYGEGKAGNRLTEAFAPLINRLINLPYYGAIKDKEERLRIAALGFAEAIKRFIPSRGKKLATLVHWIISFMLRDEARKASRCGIVGAPRERRWSRFRGWIDAPKKPGLAWKEYAAEEKKFEAIEEALARWADHFGAPVPLSTYVMLQRAQLDDDIDNARARKPGWLRQYAIDRVKRKRDRDQEWIGGGWRDYAPTLSWAPAFA